MTSTKMAAVLAAFKKLNDDANTGNRQSNYYPFWNIKEGDEAVVRFLPDKDQENPFGFVVEKRTHTLLINGENKTIPCLTMYGEDCPICKVSTAFYKAGDKVNGKKYWRKKQNLAQALIVRDPLPPEEGETENHEGKVRLLALGYQIFEVIKAAFESGDMDEVPFAYKDGTNFHIKKTKQGEYSTYAIGSKFARKSTDLTDEQLAVVEEHLVELKSLLPAKPTLEKVESMLQAALTGAEYKEEDAEEETDTSPSVKNLAKAFAASEDEDDVPFETEKKPTKPAATKKVVEETDDDEGDDEAEQILARIRNRTRK